MKVLADTHAILWWLGARDRLSSRAVSVVGRAGSDLLLSTAVVWEIAIKRSVGKLEAPADVVARVLATGATPLPVTIEHAEVVETLPWHHRDPFDRLLVAQATVEGATILSADERLRGYGIDVVW